MLKAVKASQAGFHPHSAKSRVTNVVIAPKPTPLSAKPRPGTQTAPTTLVNALDGMLLSSGNDPIDAPILSYQLTDWTVTQACRKDTASFSANKAARLAWQLLQKFRVRHENGTRCSLLQEGQGIPSRLPF